MTVCTYVCDLYIYGHWNYAKENASQYFYPDSICIPGLPFTRGLALRSLQLYCSNATSPCHILVKNMPEDEFFETDRTAGFHAGKAMDETPPNQQKQIVEILQPHFLILYS